MGIVSAIALSGLLTTALAGCAGSSNASSTSCTANCTASTALAAGGATTVYVVQQGSGASSILEFPVTSAATATPTATLTTPTGTVVESVATDSSGQIYVGVLLAANFQGEVLVYPAGSTGAATPTRTILGAIEGSNATTFTEPKSMVVGANGILYIVSIANSAYSLYSVAAMASTANGAATPLSFITGTATQLTDPVSIAVDTSANIYVSNIAATATPSGQILVFASGATGNVAPTRTITSSQVFYGVAVDAGQNIYTVEDSPTAAAAGSIVEFTAGASGAATPAKTISGSSTGFFLGGGVRLDSVGNLFVVNAVSPTTSTTQTVLAYPPTASGNVVPAVNFTSTAWSSGGSELAVK
jgi:hypothetical protein